MALLGAVLAAPAHAQQDSSPDFGTGTIAEQIFTQDRDVGTLVAFPAATGGDGALTYSLTGPNATANDADLPGGLSFDAATRVLSGTPTAPLAKAAYTYRVVDSDTTDPDEDIITFKIGVAPKRPTRTVTAVDGQVTVAWEAIAGVTGWSHYLSDSFGGRGRWTDIDGSSDSTTGHTLTGLTNGTVYDVSWHAFVGTGDNRVDRLSWSVRGVAPLADGAPDGRIYVEEANPDDSQVTLIWEYNGNDSSITGWRYRQATQDPNTFDYSWDDWLAIPGSTGSTRRHAVTGLTNGTDYYFVLQPVSSAGVGPHTWSVYVTAGPPKPDAPSGLVASAGDGAVTLEWDDPDDASITGWQYSWYTASSGLQDWADIADSGPSTVSHTVTGLTNGTDYSFRVRAVNANGAGRESYTGVVVPGTPAVPSGLVASAGDGAVTLEWDDPGDASITGWQYRLFAYADNARWRDWADIADSGPSTASHTVTELTNETYYNFRVRAVNANGAGRESQIVFVDLRTLAAPSGLVASAGDGEATLEWDDAGDASITGWQYEWWTNYSGWQDWADIADSGPSTASHTVTGLTNGRQHSFRVRAVNANGTGRESYASVVPGTAVAGTPAAPSGFVASAGDGEATLEWDDPGDASITGWQYRWRTASSGWQAWTDIAGSGSSTTSHTVTGLAKGTEHFFAVRAVNANGAGISSRRVGVTPSVAPVVAVEIADQSVSVGGWRIVDLANAFSDADGDVLAFSFAGDLVIDGDNSDPAYVPPVGGVATLSTAPAGGPASQLLVTGVAAGSTAVTVTAADPGGRSVTDVFTVTVTAAVSNNQAPTVAAAIPDEFDRDDLTVGLLVGSSKTFDLDAVFGDADTGDVLTFTAASSAPDAVSVSVDGSELTVSAQSPGYSLVVVNAYDGNGGLAVDDLIVSSVVSPRPVVVEVADLSVSVGGWRVVDLANAFGGFVDDQVVAAAAADDGVVELVSPVSRVECGCVIDSLLRVKGLAEGSTMVTVSTAGPGVAPAKDTFMVTVTAAVQDNKAPTVADALEDVALYTAGAVTLDLADVFADDDDSDVLSYIAESASPAVARVSVTGSELRVAAGAAAGESLVTVRVYDGNGGSVSDDFTVTVTQRPPPVVTPVRPVPVAAAPAAPVYTGRVCPASAVPAGGFEDLSGWPSEIANAVDCIAWDGITRGTTATTFAPADPLSRGQVALFLTRLINKKATLPADENGEGSWQGETAAAAAQLGQLGIVDTGAYTADDDDSPIERAELALYVARVLTHLGLILPSDPPSRFNDLAGQPPATAHAINQLADIGVMIGTTETTFEPTEPLTRSQMALVLTRMFARLGIFPGQATG